MTATADTSAVTTPAGTTHRGVVTDVPILLEVRWARHAIDILGALALFVTIGFATSMRDAALITGVIAVVVVAGRIRRAHAEKSRGKPAAESARSGHFVQ